MTQFEQRINAVQRRMWMNRWLTWASRSVGVGAAVFAAIVLVQRLYDLTVPIPVVGLVLGAAAVAISAVVTIVTRESAAVAAATLDQVAGLRERLSSARCCIESDDPFARAVVGDAEQVSAALSVRRHIPIRAPRSLPFAAVPLVVAALMFTITPGLLSKAGEDGWETRTELVERARIAVKSELKEVRRLAETNPALEDLQEELGDLNKDAGGLLKRPEDVRHEAVKKIDKLQDVVAQKRKTGNYEAVKEARKMMRRLKVPGHDQAPTRKLAKALVAGDFKAAREEVEALREQLATLKSDEDKEVVAKISKQLEELGKQLERAARNEKLAGKLAELGLKREDIKRMLKNLRKKDVDQLKKQLADKGWSQQQIKRLVNQLKKGRKAGAMADKLAKALKQGGTAAAAGEMGRATAGLSMAADQLSELEQLEQEMLQLDSAMAALAEARNNIDSSGSGGGDGNRPGLGMGKLGRGRGGLAPEQATSVSFKTERAKVHTGKGAIIGQFLVEGDQIKGDVSSTLTEVISAAERDASDRINRDRVPRQYQKAVKTYFSSVKRAVSREGDRKSDSTGADGASEAGGTRRDPEDR